MPLVGVLLGSDLPLHWGTPFLLFAVPAAMEITRPWVAWPRVALRPALVAFGLIQTLLLVVSQLTSPLGPLAQRERHWRAFDSAALAGVVGPVARQALHGPICLVIGGASKAGALALALPERPQVLIDGRYDRSPWVDKHLIDRCGALELSDAVPMPGGNELAPPFAGLRWRVLLPLPLPPPI